MAIAVLLKIASSGVKQLPSRATACENVAQRVFSFAGGGGVGPGADRSGVLNYTVQCTQHIQCM